MSFTVFQISLDAADVWVATDTEASVDYSYGGTRMIDPFTKNSDLQQMLRRLMYYESSLKNQLINRALKENALDVYKDRLPKEFLESTVGGARCIIKPRTTEIFSVLKDPTHPEFYPTILCLFEHLGRFLNEAHGKIKLTPDFGRFSELADILAKFTPHVLGIRCEDGGCGGKTSYSSSGVIAAMEALNIGLYKVDLITLIGSAGAMGTDVLEYVRREHYTDIALCDLVYDNPQRVLPPDNFTVLPSQEKRFTDECLRRGGFIVATTIGQELENSNWQVIPKGATLLLAHNLAIPEGEKGIMLMKQLADQGVFVLPGQILTLGGALTSRLEWFWRQTKPNQLFDKQLAHTVVRDMVRFLLTETLTVSRDLHISPYEAMLSCSGDGSSRSRSSC